MAATVDLDRIDRRILTALQQDGRLTNQALSERVALSPSACLARVRRLEGAGVIQGYHARLDPFAIEIGVVLYAEVTLKGHGPADLKLFEDTIAAIPAVVEASHVTGAYDYLLNDYDRKMFEWVKKFNPYDLYSKSPTPPNLKELKPYYEDLLAKYLPETIRL